MLGLEAAAQHAHSECGADALTPSASPPSRGKKGVRKVKRRAASTGPVAAEGDKAGGPGELASSVDGEVLDWEGRTSASAAEREVEVLLSHHLAQIQAARAADKRAEELISHHLSQIRARRQDGVPSEGKDGAAVEADLRRLVGELAALGKTCQLEAPKGPGLLALERMTELAGEEPPDSTVSEPAVRRPAGWRRMMGRLPLAAAFGWSVPPSAPKEPAGPKAAAPPPLQFEVDRWAARVRRAHTSAAPKPAGGLGWSLEGWLRSGPAPAELARVLSRQLGAQGDPALQLAFARALPELSGPEAVRDLLHRSSALDALATALCTAARQLNSPGGQHPAAELPGAWQRQLLTDLARGKAAEGKQELATSPSWAWLRAYFGLCWAPVHRELVAAMQRDLAETAATAGRAGGLGLPPASAAHADDALMQAMGAVLEARRRWSEPQKAPVEAVVTAMRRAGGETQAATQVAALLSMLDACAGDEKLLSQALQRLPSAASAAVLHGKIVDYRKQAATRNGFLACLAGILATPEAFQGETECWEELHLLAACASPDISLPWFFRRALEAAHWTWTPPDLVVSLPGMYGQLTHTWIVLPAAARQVHIRFRVEDSAEGGALIVRVVKRGSRMITRHRVSWPGLPPKTAMEVAFSPAEQLGAGKGDTLALDYECSGSTFVARHIRVAVAPEDDFVKLLADTAQGITQLSQRGASLKLLRLLVCAGTVNTSELADLDSFFSSLWWSLGRLRTISLFNADEKSLQDIGYARQQFNKIGKSQVMRYVRRHIEENCRKPECTQARFDEESVLVLLLATLVVSTTKETLAYGPAWYAQLILGCWEAQGAADKYVFAELVKAGKYLSEEKARTGSEALEAFKTAALAVGDLVEAEYEGKRYVGELESFDAADNIFALRCPDITLTGDPWCFTQLDDHQDRGTNFKRVITAIAAALVGLRQSAPMFLTYWGRDYRTDHSGLKDFVEWFMDCYDGDVRQRTYIDDPGWIWSFSLYLMMNPDLAMLDFSSLKIFGDDAASAAAEALVGNTTLRAVNAVNCYIHEDGGVAIAKVLRTTQLQELYLGGNVLNNPGAIAIADALADERVRLTALDLSSCNFGASGGRALAAALGKNDTLRSFWLHGNMLGLSEGRHCKEPRFATALEEALCSNRRSALRFVWVQHTRLREREYMDLELLGKSRGIYFYRH